MKSPWAVILCKFTDGNDEPFPKQYYKNLFTASNNGSPWNMISYFKDYSHGSLDLTGTKVFGWYQLNKSVEDYNSLKNAARHELIKWARAAAVAGGVDLKPFFSVVAVTNLWHDIGAPSTLSGVVAQGPTPIPQLLGHEMGHVYGLQHSRIDGSTDDYMDPWDIMSAAGNAYSASEPEFSLIGPGVNAWNMRRGGWLDESRVWKNTQHTFDEIIMLRPLVRRDLSGFLAAEIPGGYLLEFRVREGWDGAIPRAAVLVHRFQADHSYLMPGNLGSSDLIAGDSFGEPELAQKDMFSDFKRVDVISIDSATNEAKLRIRYHRRPDMFDVAVDPMAVILSGRAYLIWLELKHPHVPKVAEIQAVLATMTTEERKAAVIRARTFTGYGKAFEKAMTGLERQGGT